MTDNGLFVGQYGAERLMLDVYERDDVLFADGCGHEALRLTERANRFEADGLALEWKDGQPSATVGDEVYQRCNFAARAAQAFRDRIQADLSELRVACLAAQPPLQTGRSSALVDIASIDPTIIIDMRYATTNNFLGMALYDHSAAYLERAAAEALARAQSALKARGYRLLVLDAYRPWSISWLFWQVVPIEFRKFVADPAVGSKHNRGCAVDVTLLPLGSDVPVKMPSEYDEASARAGPNYHGATTEARSNRDMLRHEMERSGFSVDPSEWWHYDFGDWHSYPIRNDPLSSLR